MTTADPISATPHPARAWRRALKLMLIAAVIVAVGWRVWGLLQELRARDAETGLTLSVSYPWIGVSAAAFILGSGLYGLFWCRLLTDSGVPVTRRAGLRAYYSGTVGKYLPGKAWVVLLRTGLVDPGPRSRFLVAMTVLYETLSQMAVGAAFAALCLVCTDPQRWPWWSGAFAVAAGLAILLHPRVFARVVKTVSLPFKQDGAEHAPTLRPHTLLRGGFLILAGWILLGTSLVAVVQATGGHVADTSDLLRLCGAAALANAAGFLVLFMPSGIAVREFVIIELLAPRFGIPVAVVSSLLLRLVWTCSEVGVSGLLYGLGGRLSKLSPNGRATPSPRCSKGEEPGRDEPSREAGDHCSC